MAGKLVILGAGKSGIGTAILGKKKGYSVFMSEYGVINDANKQKLDKLGVVWEEKKHTKKEILDATIVMKSPGISEDEEIVKEIRKEGISIVSEIEFAGRYTDAKIIGITGSNGKTTTATLVCHLLKEGGLNVGLAGNIGISFAQQVAEESFEYYVLEISSFQLDDIHEFSPEYTVITNITPDHLDRYQYDFAKYVQAKMNIVKNHNKNNFLIFNGEDVVLVDALKKMKVKSKLYPFGFEKHKEEGTYYSNGNIVIEQSNEQKMVEVDQFQLKGRHNLLNAMAAVSVANLLKISNVSIRESLFSFKGVSHRLENVLDIGGVTYINDSKATNVNAVFYALESMTRQVVWIVGGIDKGNEYEILIKLVREKVKAIVCLGVDSSRLLEVFGPVVGEIRQTQSMEEAVKMASELADKKDAVLLSPACSSFDLFDNYEDRGNQFKKAIRNL